MTITPSPILRIGIDCGGTNTDAVILDLSPGATRVVLASIKTPTTPEVTHGIRTATSAVLKHLSPTEKGYIQSINIGTTHFVNALIQRSEDRLERVAVIRLCGPFSRRTPPFAGFPYELKEILQGPHFFAEGGLQIDGSEITKVDEKEIEAICEDIKRADIRAVAISSVYSPIDFTLNQEETVESVVKRCIPGVFSTCSKKVANIGLLERENATILNTALLPFAHVTVQGFRSAAEALGLPCPVFVTGNDGTLLSLHQAAMLPIRTFSSGPTNSMRGAGFLAGLHDPGAKRETALVVDIGGTTTEVGVLLPSGFPRQAASHHELCGVNLNFAMPHVTSIGLGGGSMIRQQVNGKVTVGPDSVGYKLLTEGLVFGGKVLTGTDIAVAARGLTDVGDATAVGQLSSEIVEAAVGRMKIMLELCLDSMKTSNEDIAVYLVGGGAILAPPTLKGISKIHRFPHYDCANAVGAAIAQVAGSIDTVEELGNRSTAQVQREVEKMAIDRAIEAGAKIDTVEVVESEAIPIAYTAGKCRFFAKATGDWAGKASLVDAEAESNLGSSEIILRSTDRRPSGKTNIEWTPDRITSYRPRVHQGSWYLSEIDLEFICIGTYILGCGGGGDPSHDFLACMELLRAGDEMRVIDLGAIPGEGLIGWGGGLGSPEVSLERLLGEEYNEAMAELLEFLKIDKLEALAALEIGGSNGMINFLTGARSIMNLPIVDGDFMGRAYPTGWQTTPNVYDYSGRGENLLPASIASGDGNSMFMTKAKNDRFVDIAFRAACVEMGTHVGAALKPLTADFCQTAMIKNTVSQSWRLGRAVMVAQKTGEIGNIGNILVDALGGPSTAKILFAGKITSVDRRVYKGHSIGEVIIQALQRDDEGEATTLGVSYQGTMKIPFKNENLYCEQIVNGSSTIVATVPDLVAVLDSGNGRALGTPDYKYGQRVLVLGITAAPQWTDTPRGLELGDLRAFGYNDIPYEPLGVYAKPRSVIEEYDSQ